MGFQTAVNLQQAPAQAGDFASNNPIASVPSFEGGFIAGAGGVNIGAFAWIQADGKTLLNTGEGVPDGFVHRSQQAQIVTFLADNGYTIQAGQSVNIQRMGSFYAVSTGAAASLRQKAFASYINGLVQPAATGTSPGSIAITASTATNVLTVTATAGVLLVGQLITGAGIPANTYIASQTSGTAGSTGTYTLTTSPGTVASESMTANTWVETPFVIDQACASGELTVISAT